MCTPFPESCGSCYLCHIIGYSYVDICAFPFVFLCFMLFYVDNLTSTGRQVDRFKVSCFSMSTGFALVYVDRFKVFLMYILWLAKRYSILITHFTRIIDRAWTLRIYKYVIISGRYTARKQWKLYIINMKMATCPYIIGILIRHLIPSTLIKVKTKK